MPECELCGAKTKSRAGARINGVFLEVCLECAKSGTAVEAYKPAPVKPVQFKVEPEEVLVMDYALAIRQAREKANLKQEELAVKLNEKLSVIQAAESGKRLDLNLAKKIEKLFGIKLTEIV